MAKTNWLFDEVSDIPKAPVHLDEVMMVARIYDNLTDLYSGRPSGYDTNYIPHQLKDPKKIADRKKQLQRLIDLCQELGVPVELYLKAQFEEMGHVLRKWKIRRPPMSQILSPAALDRFAKYLDRVDKSYISQKDKLRQHMRRVGEDRIKLFMDSAQEFYHRLERVKQVEPIINREVVLRELEMASRASFVSSYYVAFSPLVKDSKSTYLQSIQASVLKRLNQEQQAGLRKARGLLKWADEELGQYV